MKPFSWIKLSTDFFEDPKVLRLQTYPEKDFLLIFWIKIVLLSLRRDDGLLLIDDTLPYSVSDFVSMFKKDESVIRMALSIFEKLNMIVVNPSGVGEIIGLREFVGFTDVEGLEDSRRKNREKQAAFRKRQKEALLAIESSENENTSEESEEVTGYSPVSNQKVTGQNRTEKEQNRKKQNELTCQSVVFSENEKKPSEELSTHLQNAGFSPKDATTLISKYPSDRISRVLEYAKKKKPASLRGFVLKALREEWVLSEISPVEMDPYQKDLRLWKSLSYELQRRYLNRGGFGSNSDYPEPGWLRKVLEKIESDEKSTVLNFGG